MNQNHQQARRQFMAYFSGVGLSATLFPGVLWARLQDDAGETQVTKTMMLEAARLAGLEFNDEEYALMMDEVNKNLAHYREMRQTHLDNAVAPPLYFDPVVPGMQVPHRSLGIPRRARAFGGPSRGSGGSPRLEDRAPLRTRHGPAGTRWRRSRTRPP